MSKIPLIDILPFCDSSLPDVEKRKQQVAKELYSACTDTGFFLIKNYERVVPQSLIDDVFRAAHQFFELPASSKETLKPEPFEKGYVAIGEENLTTVYADLNASLENKQLGDFKEGFDFGRELDLSHPEYGLQFRKPNKWPTEFLGPKWRETIIDYYERTTNLGHLLMRIFAIALDLDENWFADKHTSPMTSMRILHYPPDNNKDRFGCGAHSDYGCCTMLAQDSSGGLQLLSSAGEWIDVPSIPSTLVINVGDMMQRWTNDKFKSTIHRVINKSGKHRFSVPFFYEPNMDTVVSCIESCKDPVLGAKHPPIKYADHLENMYKATFYVSDKK